jgi:hypothetical protein
MGWRGTLVLALLVALAATAFLLTPKPGEELPDTTLLGEPRFVRRETPAPKLLAFSPAEVARITLGYHDEVVTVARTGSQWRGAADARPLDDFLRSLSDATVIASLKDESQLADFGLDTPARRVLLETERGQPVVLLIGERNPAGTSVYVRAGEGPPLIAGALVVWEFDKAFAAITGRRPAL